MLGKLDLAATESGQAEVGDLECLCGSAHIGGMCVCGGVERRDGMGWNIDV